MKTTHHQRPDDGQWFARDEGEDRYTHEPFVYWHPIYPDAPKVDLRRVWADEKETGYVPPPPPRQPAIPVDPEHPAVPAKVRAAIKKAAANGWTTSLTRAENAVGAHYLCVRAAKPGRRMALLWKFIDARDGKLKGQPHRYPAEWRNDEAWRGVYQPCTHTEVLKELAT